MVNNTQFDLTSTTSRCDDYGKKYKTTWTKLNLGLPFSRAIITTGASRHV
jgi:hypothetical protein